MLQFRKIGRKVGLYAGVAAVLLGTLLPVAAASAQTTTARPPLNLVTSPLPLNVVTKPGQTVTADLRVKNNGARPEQLKVEVLKFGASGDTGRPQLQEREPQDLYFNWVSFSETNFNADPNVWKTIKMTIKAPKEAAFGYYYAVLFSRANPDRPTGNASAVEGGVASLVLLNVEAPGARREARVAEIVSSQKVYEFLPAKFTVKLRNSGNVHVSPVGTMFIKRGNTQVATVGFNQEQGNILPGTNRVFDLNWADGFPSYKETGQGDNAKRTLEWDFSKLQKLRFGKYTATLVAVYDDGQRDVPVEAVVTFWVIPWRILGIILLIVLLIGGGIWGVMHLLWKGLRRQALAPAAAPGANTTTNPAANPTSPTASPLEPAEENPDPSSLAAAFSRKKKKNKPQDANAEPSPLTLQQEVAAPNTTQPAAAAQAPRNHEYRPKKKKTASAPVAQHHSPGQAAIKRTKNRNKKRKQASRRRDSGGNSR